MVQIVLKGGVSVIESDASGGEYGRPGAARRGSVRIGQTVVREVPEAILSVLRDQSAPVEIALLATWIDSSDTQDAARDAPSDPHWRYANRPDAPARVTILPARVDAHSRLPDAVTPPVGTAVTATGASRREATAIDATPSPTTVPAPAPPSAFAKLAVTASTARPAARAVSRSTPRVASASAPASTGSTNLVGMAMHGTSSRHATPPTDCDF